MKKLTILLMFMTISAVKSEEKIIYKYEKHQKVDLGDLEIKGKVLAPGDITISERERKRFRRDLYDRREWDQEVRIDVLNMR